jgi:Fur family transcriptional regulator, ferric uptake regulator
VEIAVKIEPVAYGQVRSGMTQAPDRVQRELADLDDITGALRDAGHRVSAAMRLVLNALFLADAPVSAAEIAGGMGARMPPLELTPVYRNLERLQELGAVTHVHLGHGPGLYALARGVAREYLVCEECGRVTDVEREQLDDARDRIREATGHVARFDHFPVHGHCPECAGRREPD